MAADMTTTTYAEFGIRTKQGIYWLLMVMLVVGANMVVLYAQRTGDMVRTATAALWLVAVAVATIRTLRRLDVLEQDHREPTAGMRLIFQLASMQPVLGTVPLLIGLR